MSKIESGNHPPMEAGLPKVPVEVQTVWPDRIVYTINLVHGVPGLYELEANPEHRDTMAGIIGVRYDDPHKVVIDCSECPNLRRNGVDQERVLELYPDGYGRQRIRYGVALVVVAESQRYQSRTTESKRNWQRARKYRRELRDADTERYGPMGYVWAD